MTDFAKNVVIMLISAGFIFLLNKYIKLKLSKEPKNENLEIERKFLVNKNDLPLDLKSRSTIYELKQSYIGFSPVLRIRNADDKNFIFTLKTKGDKTGLVSNEVEFPITKEEYDALSKKNEGSIVSKTRYLYYENETAIYVDIYKDNLDGLITAEVEFKTVEEANSFITPKWFSKDVTYIPDYKNANLSRYGKIPGL